MKALVAILQSAPRVPTVNGPVMILDAQRTRDIDAAIALLEREEKRITLREILQQKCSDWGTYWRAPDSHGVDLTNEQATELLADALGVEVLIKAPTTPMGQDDGIQRGNTDLEQLGDIRQIWERR